MARIAPLIRTTINHSANFVYLTSVDNRIKNKGILMTDEIAALKVTDIHKRFGDHEVLKGISLDANKGDVISLIGSSGSGKSTLLRCINLLEVPT